MRLRLAVRAVEAWLLADRERIAQFLGTRPNSVPANPDELENPKRELITLALGSRKRAIREELVPREGSGRSVGPLYTARMMEFVQDTTAGWRPDIAARVSDSLARCIGSLRRLKEPQA
jgi:hypothetical protein